MIEDESSPEVTLEVVKAHMEIIKDIGSRIDEKVDEQNGLVQTQINQLMQSINYLTQIVLKLQMRIDELQK